MNGYETYQEMGRVGLMAELTKDYNLRLYPKERITPALRVAIKKNKSEIICRVLYDSMLEQAAEHFGLELDPEKMPPPQPGDEQSFSRGGSSSTPRGALRLRIRLGALGRYQGCSE
jgi:hypothetical protein